MIPEPQHVPTQHVNVKPNTSVFGTENDPNLRISICQTKKGSEGSKHQKISWNRHNFFKSLRCCRILGSSSIYIHENAWATSKNPPPPGQNVVWTIMNTQYVEFCGRIFYQFVASCLDVAITKFFALLGSRTNRETTFAQSEAKPQRLATTPRRRFFLWALRPEEIHRNPMLIDVNWC